MTTHVKKTVVAAVAMVLCSVCSIAFAGDNECDRLCQSQPVLKWCVDIPCGAGDDQHCECFLDNGLCSCSAVNNPCPSCPIL